MNELKKCPICNGKANLKSLFNDNQYYYVVHYCGRITIQTNMYKGKKTAIKNWNKWCDKVKEKSCN